MFFRFHIVLQKKKHGKELIDSSTINHLRWINHLQGKSENVIDCSFQSHFHYVCCELQWQEMVTLSMPAFGKCFFWFYVVLQNEHGKELMNWNTLYYFRWINHHQVEIWEDTRTLLACLILMMFVESLWWWWEMGSICLGKMDPHIHFLDSNVDMAMGGSHLNMFSNMISSFHL